MNHLIPAVAIFIAGASCLGSAWSLGSRRLRNVDFYANRLEKINVSVSSEDLFVAFDCDEDSISYHDSGGMIGVWRRFKNAGLLLGILQSLVQSGNVPEEYVKHIAAKTTAVRVYSLASFAEEIFRIVASPRLPRVCSRATSGLYSDLEGTMKAILREHYPGALSLFDAVP